MSLRMRAAAILLARRAEEGPGKPSAALPSAIPSQFEAPAPNYPETRSECPAEHQFEPITVADREDGVTKCVRCGMDGPRGDEP